MTEGKRRAEIEAMIAGAEEQIGRLKQALPQLPPVEREYMPRVIDVYERIVASKRDELAQMDAGRLL